MPEIKAEQLILLAGFLLPGAISMYVYGLLVPQKEFKLQERLVEALCFSLLNFVIVYVPLRETHVLGAFGQRRTADWLGVHLLEWFSLLFGFIAVPALWPFLIVRLLRFAEARGWIAIQAKTAWDDFFGRQREGFWLQVDMSDGTRLGGRFGSKSYASAYPDPGHLYVEELWRVDEDGHFVEQWVGGPGLILRPTDYKLIRVYLGGEA